jgi:hypothetical protein
MSKTDKTNPAWVRAYRKEREVLLMEWHTKSCVQGGKCTLPREAPKHHASTYTRGVQCYWYAYVGLGRKGKYVSLCGCSLCTDHPFRRQERRKVRRMKRQMIEREMDG